MGVMPQVVELLHLLIIPLPRGASPLHDVKCSALLPLDDGGEGIQGGDVVMAPCCAGAMPPVQGLPIGGFTSSSGPPYDGGSVIFGRAGWANIKNVTSCIRGISMFSGPQHSEISCLGSTAPQIRHQR